MATLPSIQLDNINPLSYYDPSTTQVSNLNQEEKFYQFLSIFSSNYQTFFRSFQNQNSLINLYHLLTSSNIPDRQIFDFFDTTLYPLLSGTCCFDTLSKFIDTLGQVDSCKNGWLRPNYTSLNGGKYGVFHITDDNCLKFLLCYAINLYQGKNYFFFQENISAGDLLRSYADIDGDDGAVISDQDVKDIAQAYVNSYSEFYDVRFQEFPDYTWHRNLTNPQRKVHLHFPTLITTGSVHKYITKSVCDKLPHLSKYIDLSCTGLRMLFTYKPPTGAALTSIYIPDGITLPSGMKNISFKDMLTPSRVDSIFEIFEHLLYCKIRAFNWEKVPDLRPNYKSYFDILSSRINYTNNEDQEDDDEYVKMYNIFVEYIDKHSKDVKDSFNCNKNERSEYPSYTFKRLKASFCDICDRSHDKCDYCVYLANGNIMKRCWRDSRTKLIKSLGKVPDYIKKAMVEKRCKIKKSECNIMLDNTYKVPDYVQHVTYNQRYIKPINLDAPIQGFKSDMETGKSCQIRRLLQENPTFTHLSLTHRQSQAYNIKGQFDINNIMSNLYLEGVYEDGKSFICQAESIHKISNVNWDIVIIDETTSFLVQMLSKFQKDNLETNRSVFGAILQKAKYIIFSDADIDRRTYELIHSYRPNDPFVLYENLFKHPPRTYKKHLKNISFWNEINNHLTRDKKIVITTSSNQEGELIYAHLKNSFPNKRIRYINANSNKIVDINELSDPNKHWINCDVLIYTPRIGTGISFEILHFDTLFMYATPLSCCARDLMQMNRRVRQFNTPDIHYHIKNYTGNLPVTALDIYNHENMALEANRHTLNEYIKDSGLSLQNLEFGFDEQGYWKYSLKENPHDIWHKIRIYNLIEENWSINSLAIVFQCMVERSGAQITEYVCPPHLLTPDSSKQFKTYRSGLKGGIIQAKCMIFDQATRTDLIASQIHKDTNNYDETDILTVEKFEFLKHIKDECVNDIDGGLYLAVKPCIKQLHNNRYIKDLSIYEIIRYDVKYQHEKPICTQAYMVNVLAKKLGLTSIFDFDTVITSDHLMGLKGFFVKNLKLFKGVFDLQSKVSIKALVSIKGLINSILTKFLNMHLKVTVNERVSIDGKRVRKYKYKINYVDIVGEFGIAVGYMKNKKPLISEADSEAEVTRLDERLRAIAIDVS